MPASCASGQAAFFGLGGYTYAAHRHQHGRHDGAGAAGRCWCRALFAALLGYFMFWGRISDVYLGVITLTVSLIFYRFINQTAGEQWNIGDAPLGGFNGIPATPILNWPGRPGEQLAPEDIFGLTVGLLLIVYFACKALLATSFGRIIVAIRENETRAELLGYDMRVYKLAIFVVGGALAGLSGLLFANSVFVSPTMFSLPVSGQIIIWVIVGGLGTLIGPVIGCILMQFLTNYLGTLSQIKGFGWVDPNLVLGVLLVIFVLVVPEGTRPHWPPTPGAGPWASCAGAAGRRQRRRAGERVPRPMTPLLETRELTMRFGGVVAVDRRRLHPAGGRAALRHRPQRRRQEHLLQVPDGPATGRAAATCCSAANRWPATRPMPSPAAASASRPRCPTSSTA